MQSIKDIPSPEGYIFDYGGTLDTRGCHWGRYIQHAYERQGVPVDEDLFRKAYVYAERTLGRNPIVQPDFTFHKTLSTKLRLEMEYIGESLKGFDWRYWHPLVLDDLYERVIENTRHSREVLTELRHRCPMVLVSNFYGNLTTVLKEFGLNRLFDNVVESAVVGIRKPDPGIFSLGVEQLRLLPKQVAVVGDSYDKDIVPAAKVGCHTVWMKGEGWTNDEPDGQAADAIISDLDELL